LQYFFCIPLAMGAKCCCNDRHGARSLSFRDEEDDAKRKAILAGRPEGRKAVGGGVDIRKKKQAQARVPIPKSPEDEDLIREALKKNPFLKAILDKHRIEAIVKVAHKEEVEESQVLIKEGDLDGDSFYIVAKGRFKMTSAGGQEEIHGIIHSRQTENIDVILGRDDDGLIVESGGSFGELALLYLGPRSATVVALEKSEVWKTDRADFKSILMKVSEEKVEEYIKHLQQVSNLKVLLLEELRALARELVSVDFAQDELILRQDDNGSTFYILYDGEVEIIKDEEVVETLSASVELGRVKYFGESALLKNEVRAATVKVVSEDAKALVIDRETFDSVLRPLNDIISLASKGPREAALVQNSSAEVGYSSSKRPPDQEIIRQEDLVTLGYLGRGGFGYVELVENSRTGQTFALKALQKGFIVQKDMEKNVMHEKNVQIILKSPFIVKLYETYNHQDRLFFLLEPALGGELFQVYQKCEFYGSARHAKYYSAGVVNAFEYLHSLSIVYRDLKPENMLLTDKGHMKLTDMGLAKIVKGKTFTACGTPDYFAPEIVKQTGHGLAVDWWELGVLVFEFMSGAPPFVAHDPMETFRRIGAGIDRVRFPQHCKGVVEDLVKQMCKRQPSERLPMRAGGTNNIRQHLWFSSSKFDWEAMQNLTMKPPFEPDVRDPKDLSNFPPAPSEGPDKAEYEDDGSGWDAEFATA